MSIHTLQRTFYSKSKALSSRFSYRKIKDVKIGVKYICVGIHKNRIYEGIMKQQSKLLKYIQIQSLIGENLSNKFFFTEI